MKNLFISLGLLACVFLAGQTYDQRVKDTYSTSEINADGIRDKMNNDILGGLDLAFYQFTAAQLLAGDTVTLVAAPGTNKYNVPLFAYMGVQFDTAYTGAGDITIHSTYDGSDVTIATFDSAAFQSERDYSHIEVVTTTGTVDDNAAITIHVPDYVTGTSIITVYLLYKKEEYPEVYK